MKKSDLDLRLRSKYLRWYFLDNNKTLGPKAEEIQEQIKDTSLLSLDSLLETLLASNCLKITSTELFENYGIYINGSRARSDSKIVRPFKLEIYVPQESQDKPLARHFNVNENIIFEDESILAAYKPAHWPSLPLRDRPNFSAKHQIEKYLKGPAHFPSRLDSDTQGILIASKNASCTQKLHELFSTNKLEKFYLAQIAETPNWTRLQVAAPIGKSLLSPALRSVWGYDGKNARTNFWQITKTKAGSLILCKPISGRTHQIRVHLKYLGLNLIGDNLYRASFSNQNYQNQSELNLICHTLKFPINTLYRSKALDLSVPNSHYPNWLAKLPSEVLNKIPAIIQTYTQSD